MTQQTWTNRTSATAFVMFLALLVGCSADSKQGSTAKSKTDEQSKADARQSDTEATPEAKSAETDSKKELPEDPAKPETPDETNEPEADAKPAADPESKPAKRVTLGDPSLTAGIPGEGELTIDQIKTWLDDPANHEPLEFDLPLGLAAGSAQIVGVEENPLTRAKIELGRQLYFDPRLSVDTTISCASCHKPEHGFAAETQFGEGITGLKGGRNSPPAFNRILSGAQFWDGRAASLEEQAIGPIANPIEMGNTHESCAACIKGIEGYRLQFEKIFPDGVTIENIGRALATFERALVTGPSAYDYYDPLRIFEENFKDELEDLDAFKEDDPETYAQYESMKAAADAHPMSESAKRGRTLFFTEKANCTACHVGANFTDEKYHNLGVGMEAAKPDLGRFEVSKDEKDQGAFKTPTVRNITQTGPYMHDGSQKTLLEVVEWYAKGGHPNPQLSDKVKKLNLTDQDKQDLVAFMESLTGEFPKVEPGRLPK